MIKSITIVSPGMMNYSTAVMDHGVEEYWMNLERIHDKYFCDLSLTYAKFQKHVKFGE